LPEILPENRSTPTDDLQAATLEWIDRFAPYGVIATDRDLRVRSWNHWMEQHSGLPAKAVLGRALFELFPDLDQKRIPQLERALEGEVIVISTALHGWLLPLPPPNREVGFPYMQQTARIAPLVTRGQIQGVLLVIEDVTQREWQSEILRRQHARDEVLAWALAHLLKAEDPRRIIREVFCKVAGHLDFDSYLLHLYELESAEFKLYASGGIEPEQEHLIRVVPARTIPWMGTAREGQAVVREHVQSSTDSLLANARQFGFRAYVDFPLIIGRTLLGLLSFATRTRDTIAPNEIDLLSTIAEYLSVALNREKTDRELRTAQQKLNEHAQELEENVAERTASLKQIIAELQTFSYTIAHDLRAPIRALKGYCDVLAEDFGHQLPLEALSVITKLRNASNQMDVLTRDLLEFSKVSRQDLTLGRVDLADVVQDTFTLAGPRLASCTSVGQTLHTVLANRALAGQCLSNLLENALKFATPGVAPVIRIWSEVIPVAESAERANLSNFTSSRFSVAKPSQDVLPASGLPRVRLWVEDNGIGISAEAQSKIFGIFERGDRASQYEGTGIGLAIVARAMERMGGACGVESIVQQGSRFWLEFNAATHTPSNEAPTEPKEPKSSR
jgi:signal transduction histidine kinase